MFSPTVARSRTVRFSESSFLPDRDVGGGYLIRLEQGSGQEMVEVGQVVLDPWILPSWLPRTTAIRHPGGKA
jgi:hypothetical protein